MFEIQFVHSQLLMARKELPGHVIYNRVRNASELLEYMSISADEDMRAADCVQLLENNADLESAVADLGRLGMSATALEASRIVMGCHDQFTLEALKGADVQLAWMALHAAHDGQINLPDFGLDETVRAEKVHDLLSSSSRITVLNLSLNNLGESGTIILICQALKSTTSPISMVCSSVMICVQSATLT